MNLKDIEARIARRGCVAASQPNRMWSLTVRPVQAYFRSKENSTADVLGG
jgi:hypothetical protein